MFAEVIIPLYLNITYTWSIPAEWQNFVQPGMRVEVELRNKKYAGIIKAITNQKPAAFNPKPILSILDEEPLLHPQQLALWRWMAEYYVCTEGDIMQAAIPANLKLSSESILVWNEDAEVDLHDLTDNEFIVAQALEIKKQLTLSEVQQLLERRSVIAVIKTLIDKQIGFIWESLKDKYKAKTLTFVVLHPTYRNDEALEPLFQQLAKAPKQTELLLAFLHLLKTEGVVTQSQLLQKANANAAQLKGLVDKKVLMLVKKAVDRIPFLNDHTSLSFQLSAAQQNALLAIEDNFKQKQVCLLHGVTASGKTLVYIQLMDSYVKQGLQVLFMLPEIALTAQMIRRVQKYFGQDIVIYHSKLNANERVEIWNKVRTKQVKVIMGARSALFLPYQQLGLIIVDEEHDASYKQQEPAPRYHARDVAVYYATLFNAKVLLGSATPSVETYFNTQSSVSNPQPKYGLVSLHERYGQVALPAIKVVDMKPLYSTTKKKTAFSPTLIEAVTQCLQNKKQAIIFQNRRGYSPYLICNTCGWIPECRHCDVTLTYHKAKHQLACHYCGTLYPVLHSCAACGSTNITQQNFGTERLEELLAELFPLARIARMDVDTVKGKNDHEMLIKQFEAQKIDILVGTQMVVKGLDFENVTLVGIVDGDSLLHFT
ncbi:MAG: replication restart helicase PriA, partial [Chitinophagaceae bacterium]